VFIELNKGLTLDEAIKSSEAIIACVGNSCPIPGNVGEIFRNSKKGVSGQAKLL
jgi:hypothetical protein